MENLFKECSQWIRIYLGIETIDDPYEQNVETTYLNPLSIKAIISDITPAQVQYKMPGVLSEKAKEIIIEKKHESLLKKSQKIEIDGELYQGWKQYGRLQYRIEEDYIRAYLYIKQVT